LTCSYLGSPGLIGESGPRGAPGPPGFVLCYHFI
jgi:hypothetical protein